MYIDNKLSIQIGWMAATKTNIRSGGYKKIAANIDRMCMNID